MHILIVNWRSIKDPLSGGAEVATFEHAKRWVENHNAKVTWLSPIYNKNIKSEVIEGINFQYIGLPLDRNIKKLIFTFPYFYFLVFVTYMTKFRGKVDAVIDQAHGFPYLTPLYVKEKKIVYIHEVAGDIWDKMYKFPINAIGKIIEKLIFIPYKNIEFVTVSNSTKQDLIALGIPEIKIDIVYNGVSMPIIDMPTNKEKEFTIMFLNRLVKMKGIERAIDIVAEIKKQIPNLQFWIVGKGEADYVDFLKQKVKDLNLEDNVTFFGFVDEKTKMDLLTKSHVLINTSYKEGWGLVNLEANARGTPAIAFRVKGNTESIEEGVNGYLAKDGDIKDMVDKIIRMKENTALQTSSITFAKQFDWEKVAEMYYRENIVI